MEREDRLATPSTAETTETVPAADDPLWGAFRNNGLLVLHRRFPLPDRCVKSNLPANGSILRCELSWHHPAWFLTLLLGLVPYFLLSMAIAKRARIAVGISPLWKRKRLARIAITAATILLGALLICVAFIYLQGTELFLASYGLGMLLVLAGIVYGRLVARLVRPKRIDDTHVWLAGAHPDYLAELPPWPGKR